MIRNHTARRLLLASIVASFAAAAPGEDWPTAGHDNRRTGVTAEKLAPPLSLRWVFRSPGPPAKGWARPVNGYGATKNAPNVSFDDSFRVTSADGTAYFASSAENRVYAVDVATGTVRWTFFTDAAPRLAPAISQGKVYFGADDGTAYCLDADDGEVIWKLRCAPTDEKMLGTGRFTSLWPLRCGVTVDRGTAYFTAGLFPSEGVYFYAVDAANGKVIWRRQLDRGGTASPAAGGTGGPSPQGYLLVSDDSITMTSRVAPTRWSRTDGSPIAMQTPLPHHEYRFHNGGSYAQLWGENIVYGQAAILAYDPNKVLIDKYNRPQKGELVLNWFNARRVIFKDKLAYFATDYHLLAVEQARLPELAAAQCKQFEEAYKQHRVASYLTALESLAEHGEDSPMGRRLKETSLKWGKERFEQWPAAAEKLFAKFAKKCQWMLKLKANEAMIAAGDVIYAGGEDAVFAVDARTGRQLWTAQTGSRVRGLAVADGCLFVSTIDGSVRCFAQGKSTGKPREVLPPPNNRPYAADRLSSFFEETAATILRDSAADRGYCLILGGGSGRLAYEIARRSELKIYVLEPDADKVERARQTLAAAGLYGGRISVERIAVARGDSERGATDGRGFVGLPFPPYVFNLVVDQGAFLGGKPSTSCAEIFRVCKPCGGVAYMGQPAGGAALGKPFNVAGLTRDLKVLEQSNAQITFDDGWGKIVRGRVKHSRDWTHNYATAANTFCSEDPLVKGPFGILWYGEPGPRHRIERHAAGPMPLVVGSRMFLTGYDLVAAYDVYNGVRLWQRTLLGATRTGLPLAASNLAADEDGLFIVVNNRTCLQLDPATGETLRTYPKEGTGVFFSSRPGAQSGRDDTKKTSVPFYWGFVAKSGNLLYGSRSEVDRARRRPELKTSDALFALEVDTGRPVWTYEGAGIEHGGIAIAEGKVFLLDKNLSEADRRRAMENAVKDTSVEDRPAVDNRGEPIPRDLRKLIALDAATGVVQWQQPIDVTDVTLDDTVVSGGRVAVACMVKDRVLVVHGTGSLGHPYQEFLRGEFARRAIYAYAADTGKPLWGGRRNYRKRPIVVGDTIYAEPHAWHLNSGKVKTYTHPLSGRQEPVNCFRGYIGCSHLLASGAALFGNKNGIAHWNLDEPCGYTPLGGMSLACGLGAVPAGGIYVAPEGRSGCTCATPIFTSIALYPRRKARTWSVGVPAGVSKPTATPVGQMAINLGAPGFRQDASGRLWTAYPAGGGEGILGDWLPKYQHDESMCYRHSEDRLPIAGTASPAAGGTGVPWVFTSGYSHTKPLSFRLIDPGQQPAKYTVRLYFAEPEDLVAGERVFRVSLQGKEVLRDFDVVEQAAGARRAIVKQFPGIPVSGSLVVELHGAGDSTKKPPILCGIEAVREGK